MLQIEPIDIVICKIQNKQNGYHDEGELKKSEAEIRYNLSPPLRLLKAILVIIGELATGHGAALSFLKWIDTVEDLRLRIA